MSGQRSAYMYPGILFNHKKKGNSAVCDNMDWTLTALHSLNKPDRGKQILPGIT